MNSFLGFIGKLISGRGVWNNQEEINDPPVGHQNNPRETISSHCNPNPSDRQGLRELLTTSYVDPLSSNSSEQATTYAYAVSVPSIKGSSEVSVPSIQGSSEIGRLLVESNSPVSVLDTEPNQVISHVTKGESSCTDHLTLMQQSTSRNSVGDDSFKYYGGDDSSKEKLSSLEKTITEPDSTPKECKKKSSRRKRKAMKLSLMNNQNGQHNTTSQSCHLRSNFVEQDSGNYVIASSSQGSSENGHILAEHVSSPKLLGSQKQKLVMLKGTKPIDINPKYSKCWVVKEKFSSTNNLQRSNNLLSRPMKVCLVDETHNAEVAPDRSLSVYIQSEEQESLCIPNSAEGTNGFQTPIVSESFLYNHNGDSSKGKPRCPSNAIIGSVSPPVKSKKKASKQECKAMKLISLNNEKDQLTVDTSSASSQLNSLKSCAAVIYDDDSFLEELICMQGTSTEPDSRLVKSKKRASKQHRKEMKTSLLNTQNEKLTGEPSTISHADLLSSNSITPISSNANDVSEPGGQLRESSENGCMLTETDSLPTSLGSSQLVTEMINYDDDDDSAKEKLKCQENRITESDPKQTKRTKSALRRQRQKAMKLSLLPIQNDQLIGESSTSSHSDPLSSISVEQIISNANAVSVPSGHGIGENGYLSVDFNSPTSVLDSKPKFANPQMAKEESSCADHLKLIQKSNYTKSSLGTSCLVNGSTYASLDKTTVSGYLQPKVQESHCDQKSLENNNGSRDSLEPGSIVYLGNDGSLKEKLSYTDTTITKPDSTPVKSKNKTSKKQRKARKVSLLNNQNGHLIGESSKTLHSVSRNNGSHLHDKASTSPTSATKIVKRKRKIQGYHSSHNILLVGEGNFSFSSCIARAFDSAPNLVATSLNSEAYLECNYKDAMKNITELRMRGCKVLHDVDATTMADHSSLACVPYDRIIYNFPHCGDFSSKGSSLRSEFRSSSLHRYK